MGICHFGVTPRHKVTRVLKLLDNKNILLRSDVLLRACPKNGMRCFRIAFLIIGSFIGSRVLVIHSKRLMATIDMATITLLGAVNGTRTRDPRLGKPMLYQLSYYRVVVSICEDTTFILKSVAVLTIYSHRAMILWFLNRIVHSILDSLPRREISSSFDCNIPFLPKYSYICNRAYAYLCDSMPCSSAL